MDGYWNGRPANVRRVLVTIADSGRFPKYWAKDLVGQDIDAVEVKPIESAYEGNRLRSTRTEKVGTAFYLDDRDGSGWFKVTEGRGAPSHPSRSVEISQVVRELEAPAVTP